MSYICRFCNTEIIGFDCLCQNRINNKDLWKFNPRRKDKRTHIKVEGRIYFHKKKPLKKKSKK
ncbi:hypothetical protein KAI04_04400 [Candidatus Pacearchaeota archaeon]|nr:hypothetical protein [Candidatus Pacearchaeota archaeon]